ncbi:iron(III) transport system substrate-binding protein [Rhizobium sp. PP-WC-2G-219]|nr:iron(III) transport system substrate-binding protein [Rhizobium sp. PP-CC-3A-592]TCL92376.1 iron(III) transport system substrate-binding protein [Rhizobium sp. PP-WC-2G-219]
MFIRTLLATTILAGLAFHAQAEETITVYTSQPQDQMTDVIKAFNSEHPDIKIELFRSGTTEIMAKLQAEYSAGKSPADVILIADTVAMTQLKTDDRLLAMPDAPVADIDPAFIDADKTYFGTKVITTGIVYNTNLVKAAPKSWNDLLASDVAKSLIMPSPLYSGAAVIHMGTMTQQPQFGWAYYEKLAEAGAVAGQGNGTVIEAVARGEKAYGIIIEYMALNAKKKGSPVAFVFPSEGVSSITQPVAVLKASDTVEAAKTFVAWQLSKTAQEQASAQGYFPVLPGIAQPNGYPALDTLKILPADSAAMLKADAESKERFAELFGG